MKYSTYKIMEERENKKFRNTFWAQICFQKINPTQIIQMNQEWNSGKKQSIKGRKKSVNSWVQALLRSSSFPSSVSSATSLCATGAPAGEGSVWVSWMTKGAGTGTAPAGILASSSALPVLIKMGCALQGTATKLLSGDLLLLQPSWDGPFLLLLLLLLSLSSLTPSPDGQSQAWF